MVMNNDFYWKYSFPMKKGIWDNDYYFYDDGKIRHCYDVNNNSYNNEEYVNAEDIPEKERMEMLQNCPADKQEKIKTFLKL